jgi:agmatine/peptidylarginine deiminase
MRIVAEWETQESIMLVFPFAGSAWDENLSEAEELYSKIITQISDYQKCTVVANNTRIDKFIFNNNVSILKRKTDDVWIRDFGPISTKYGDTNLLKEFNFNGWGDKFTHFHDNKFNKTVFKNMIQVDLTLEGGGIETNGAYTILTTKNTILNQNRNPNADINNIKKLFEDEFGIKKIIVLENCSLDGDDTDSHIDMFCRFIDIDTIMYISTDDKKNPNYHSLIELEKELKLVRGLDNKKFNLIKLPLPDTITYKKQNLPATYANFLITNKSVLVPIYGDKNDKLALSKITKSFKGRSVIGINSMPLIKHGGAIHCATMPIFI